MKRSDSITELMTALAKLRMLVGKIQKDSKNPFFKSSYASLPHIIEAIEAPLQECNLSFSQPPDGKGLTTIVCHTESGEFLESTFEMVPQKDDPQGWGSAITYNRRYSLVSTLGLNLDEDDDGNKASEDDDDDKPWLNENTPEFAEAKKWLSGNPNRSVNKIREKYKVSKKVEQALKS